MLDYAHGPLHTETMEWWRKNESKVKRKNPDRKGQDVD